MAIKRTDAEYLVIQNEAKRLFIEHHMTQKAVAKQLKVAEKTMSGWVNKYGWKEEHEKGLYGPGDSILVQNLTGSIALGGLAKYLKESDPALYKSLLSHITIYLTLPSE